jgi:hypothetical protein
MRPRPRFHPRAGRALVPMLVLAPLLGLGACDHRAESPAAARRLTPAAILALPEGAGAADTLDLLAERPVSALDHALLRLNAELVPVLEADLDKEGLLNAGPPPGDAADRGFVAINAMQGARCPEQRRCIEILVNARVARGDTGEAAVERAHAASRRAITVVQQHFGAPCEPYETHEHGAAVRADRPTYCPDLLGGYFALPTLQLPAGHQDEDSAALRMKASLLRSVQVRAEGWLLGADGRLVATACRAPLIGAEVTCE